MRPTANEMIAQGWPNALGFSGGALLDRENGRADIWFQNRTDLARREAPSAASPCWARAGLCLLLELFDTLKHTLAIFGCLYPCGEPTSETAITPAMLISLSLAECRLHKIFDEAQMSSIIGPQRFTAALDLEPQRKMEIPIDCVTDTDLSWFIVLPIACNEDT
jgi:hypothetical protein